MKGTKLVKSNLHVHIVAKSFWTKQKSCITLKVSLRKWCPFLFLYVLVDVILLRIDFLKRTQREFNFLVKMLQWQFAFRLKISFVTFIGNNFHGQTFSFEICQGVVFVKWKNVRNKSCRLCFSDDKNGYPNVSGALRGAPLVTTISW